MITSMITLGVKNNLVIKRESPHGLYLQDMEGNEVLLPKRYVTTTMHVDDEIDVFVASDSEDRIVALTCYPSAQKNEFGYFRVSDVSSYGAFVDWGLPKELFVPKKNQKTPFKKGEFRFIRVLLDEQTHRLIGDEHIGKYLTKKTDSLVCGQQITALVLAKTPLGFKAIVDNQFEGMLFHNELFEPIRTGETLSCYIKTIRPDGKLDISLQPIGAERHDIAEKRIMSVLQGSKNPIYITSKSDAKLISDSFGLSKKTFKAAITSLLKQEKIHYVEDNTALAVMHS